MANDFCWTEIKGVMNGFFNPGEGHFFRAKSINTDGDWVGMADGVGELNLDFVRQVSGNDVFSDVASHIGSAAIYFRGVFSAEGTSAVPTGAPVGIDNNFATCETAIPLRSADDEAPCGIDEKLGFFVEHRGGENPADQLFGNKLFDLAVGNVGRVLRGNDHCGDADWFGVAILDGDLSFGIGAKPGDFARFTDSAQFTTEAVGEHDRGWHELRGFAAGVAKHKTLVARPLFGGFFPRDFSGIDPLGDIGALAGESVHDVDAVGMKDIIIVGITDLTDGGSNELIVVELGAGGNFPCNDNEVRFYKSFTGDTAGGILTEARVENCVRNGITNLIGMAFANRLG